MSKKKMATPTGAASSSHKFTVPPQATEQAHASTVGTMTPNHGMHKPAIAAAQSRKPLFGPHGAMNDKDCG